MASVYLCLLLFAALQASSSSLHSEADDRQALLTFKEGLSDPSGSLSSWNSTDTHFCRWVGVTCSPRHPGRVVSLYLPSRGLAGTMSPAIGNLTFLRKLDLQSNMLSGEIPRTIGRLRRLRQLVLQNNFLNGEIPQELINCSNLLYLNLTVNQLHGRIPAALGSVSRLQYLCLGFNNLVGGIIPPSIGNLSSLVHLQFYQNNLEGTIPEALSNLVHLQFIQLARNNLSGTIPPLFFNMSSLQYFGFGSNKLNGSLPPDAGANLPILEEFHVGNNRLSGTVPSSLANATNIQVLSLARNSFQGKVPPEIGKLCPRRVELGSNSLEAEDDKDWEFLRSFTNCTRLQLIDLDNNNLGGMLPGYVANFSGQIQRLSMAGNKISGVIPPGIGNLVYLTDLEFAGNNLQGVIPEDIGRLQNLKLLLLQENRLSGQIPSSFGNLTQMLTLTLSDNQLDGSIPKSLGRLERLTSLDLSSNRLTGVIPNEIFTLPSLTDFLSLSGNYLSSLPMQVGSLKHAARLDLSRNNLSGNIPETLGDCESLVYLTLDSNFFTGSIPQSLGNLRALSILNLTKNAFSSSIPRELGKITGLQQLYLAHNNLSGSIPLILGNLSALIELDISYNHLDGEVPSFGVFTNLTGLSVLGNDGLCGGVPELKLPPCQAKPHDKQRQQLLLKILLPVGAMISMLFLLSLLFLFKGNITVGRMKIASLRMIDEKYPRVSYSELLQATDGFAPANLIGAGKYGSVYKGELTLPAAGNDATVAIKVFSFHQAGSSRSFMAECEVLRRVKHRNLINIITSCSSIDSRGNDFRALVLEFMPNYSLDKWLHPVSDEQWHKLSVVQLFNIAVQVADALDYLHNNSQSSIIHCDLKPSNILLGSDWTAYVTDFGLSKVLGESMEQSRLNSGSSIGIRGTIGYVAPEYGEGGQVSAAGDSYSFGITLLEMFTGRAPTDDMFRQGLSLHLFAEMAFPDKISEIIDPALLHVQPFDEDARLDIALSCITSAISVGILCSKQAPLERMSMKNAAAELHRSRDLLLKHYV